MRKANRQPITKNTPVTTSDNESYARLHQAIVRGELLPNERLIEMALAEKFGVGRAAVRTALARLEQEGLVEREPNRGARVRAISEAEAVEMYEARAVLEGLAARCAANNATKDDIAKLRVIHKQMQQLLTKGDLLGISELNASLHAEMLRMANHKTVAQLISRLQAQHVHHQHRMILVSGRAQQSLAEHKAIVDAIAAHDGDAAETIMRKHLASVVRALRERSTQRMGKG
jgi:DNA-binding GntR family transcriptional regulator